MAKVTDKTKTLNSQELITIKKQIMDLQDRTTKWYGVFCAETNGLLIEIDRILKRNTNVT